MIGDDSCNDGEGSCRENDSNSITGDPGTGHIGSRSCNGGNELTCFRNGVSSKGVCAMSLIRSNAFDGPLRNRAAVKDASNPCL